MDGDNLFIRFDWAIKHILRDKANFDILEGLVSELLGEQVTIKEVFEGKSNREVNPDCFCRLDIMKSNRLDLKAKNSIGENILVELRITHKLDYIERKFFGTCNVISKHIEIGDKYDQVKKVYSISILYCNFGWGDDYVYHGQNVFRGIHTGNNLLVNISEQGVIVPYIPMEICHEYYLLRLNAYDKVPENPLDEWMTYLKTGKIKEDTRTPGLQQAREKLRVLSMSPKERRAYDGHLDAIMVQNDVVDTAYYDGIAKGIAEKGRQEQSPYKYYSS